MNIKTLHDKDKAVSSSSIFKSEQSNAISLRILKGEKLKEHSTKTMALLLCMEGKALYETEKGVKETLLPGDYVIIEALVKHWVEAMSESHLVLFK